MNFTPQQQHSLLTKMGYTGPVDPKMMDAFLSSNPGAAATMGKFNRVLQKRVGMAAGGDVGGYTLETKRRYVRTSAGDNDIYETTYIIKDSAGNTVYSSQSKRAADAKLKELNATTTPTTTTPTPAATTNTTTDTTADTTGEAATDTATEEGSKLSTGQQLSETLIQSPESLTVTPEVAQVQATPETLVAEGAGQIGTTTTAGTTQAQAAAPVTAPAPTPAALMTATTVAPQVAQTVADTKAAQGEVSPEALVAAQQQDESAVSDLQAAQGAAILMDNPVQREIQDGELISGSAVDAAKVESLMASVQAAEATPSKEATVQGQLENLMQQFEGGETPAWAAGAMRAAQATLAQRGLGASSLAGQAIIQAAMESALPIAQADANTRAQFEAQNLSNRQQTALFAAQQRAAYLQQEFDQNFQTRVLNAAKIADVANMNFTAEQTIALENSRIANTVNLQNLSNRQAMVMAEASALANLEITNLNNRQQAAVQNAQAFLQMDMTNLSNEQQVTMFRAQSNVQALFTDQAAVNAAAQFNAASKNQTNQFFADLSSRVSMFNAEQQNAIAQFNAGEANATARLNAQIESARQQFNAQNSLIIAQANAQWRQNIATINTAAQNEANMEAARTQNALTAKALDEIWQTERDTIAYAFTSYENDLDRKNAILLSDKKDALEKYKLEVEADAAFWAGLTGALRD